MPLRGAAFNLAYWILQSRDEAEDVVQEAYLRAFRAFPNFQGDGPPLAFGDRAQFRLHRVGSA